MNYLVIISYVTTLTSTAFLLPKLSVHYQLFADYAWRFCCQIWSYITLHDRTELKKVLWCVDYNIERKEIYNLNRFKRFYGVKILNLVQFDYIRGGLFMIRLFKDTAFESKDPVGSATDVEISKEWEELNRAQYVLDTNTLESEKAIASISFNACSNRTDYTYLMFVESDIDQSRGNMVIFSKIYVGSCIRKIHVNLFISRFGQLCIIYNCVLYLWYISRSYHQCGRNIINIRTMVVLLCLNFLISRGPSRLKKEVRYAI